MCECGIVFALCVFILSPVFFSVIMGQATSIPLPLMTDHFSDFKSRAQTLSVLVKKNKLMIFFVPPSGLPLMSAGREREPSACLIDLLESILFTHNPTWDDCQLLQVLFTTEERERILSEAQKNVPGVDGRPTTQPNLIDERFRLTRPRWDFERAKGRERL